MHSKYILPKVYSKFEAVRDRWVGIIIRHRLNTRIKKRCVCVIHVSVESKILYLSRRLHHNACIYIYIYISIFVLLTPMFEQLMSVIYAIACVVDLTMHTLTQSGFLIYVCIYIFTIDQ